MCCLSYHAVPRSMTKQRHWRTSRCDCTVSSDWQLLESQTGQVPTVHTVTHRWRKAQLQRGFEFWDALDRRWSFIHEVGLGTNMYVGIRKSMEKGKKNWTLCQKCFWTENFPIVCGKCVLWKQCAWISNYAKMISYFEVHLSTSSLLPPVPGPSVKLPLNTALEDLEAWPSCFTVFDCTQKLTQCLMVHKTQKVSMIISPIYGKENNCIVFR